MKNLFSSGHATSAHKHRIFWSGVILGGVITAIVLFFFFADKNTILRAATPPMMVMRGKEYSFSIPKTATNSRIGTIRLCPGKTVPVDYTKCPHLGSSLTTSITVIIPQNSALGAGNMMAFDVNGRQTITPLSIITNTSITLPTVTLLVNGKESASVSDRSNVTVTWKATNAKSCVASPAFNSEDLYPLSVGWSGSKSLNGSSVFKMPASVCGQGGCLATLGFGLKCSNEAGVTRADALSTYFEPKGGGGSGF